jgi:hypothetical protein
MKSVCLAMRSTVTEQRLNGIEQRMHGYGQPDVRWVR